MSTYYDFYLYVKHEGKFKYCGPYHDNGKAASIFAVTGSSIHVWDFENDSRNLKIRLLEASKAWFDTHTSFKYHDAKFNDCVFLVVQS